MTYLMIKMGLGTVNTKQSYSQKKEFQKCLGYFKDANSI